VDRHFADLDTRTGDETPECGSDISTWMLIERLKDKHTLCKNDRQDDNDDLTAIAGIKELAGCFVLLMILYQIADNQDWCRPACVCSPAMLVTRSLGSGLADFRKRHPLSLIAGGTL
jgi:hypothetical protein